MSKLGALSSTRTMRADRLRIHPTAQRRLNPTHFRQIRDALKVDSIGVLHVVEYAIEGTMAWWVVDGQHRLRALLDKGHGTSEVTVMLHPEVKDDASASALFLELNKRASIHPFCRFENELQSGNPVAVGVARIAAEHGFEVARGNRDGTISCVGALKGVYAKDGGAALSKTLGAVAAAWGHASTAVEGKLIEGIGLVFAAYNGQVDVPTLVKKLAKYPGGAPALLGSARGINTYKKTPVPRCVAEVVIETYNSGRRSGALDPL